MPRHPEVFAEATFYHVSNRTTCGHSLFLDGRAAEEFVERLLEARARDGFAVFAWCLMSNHYHLVVRTGHAPFSRSLLLIEQPAAPGLSPGPAMTDPRWQPRCRARPLSRRGALDGAVAYVHLNPVAAGLTADPADYCWSGHRELLGLEPPSVVDVDLALARFGLSHAQARQAYLDLLRRLRARALTIGHAGPRSWRREECAPAQGHG